MYHKVEFSNSIVAQDLKRLVNHIWKLLPMRENEEDWQRQLDIVLVELYGLNAMFGDQLDFLILITKLEGLRKVVNFDIYRTTVFSAITLLTELANSIC